MYSVLPSVFHPCLGFAIRAKGFHGGNGDDIVLFFFVFVVITHENRTFYLSKRLWNHRIFLKSRELNNAFKTLVIRPIFGLLWLSENPIVAIAFHQMTDL